jgi:ketosteroid isomerase-like protein
MKRAHVWITAVLAAVAVLPPLAGAQSVTLQELADTERAFAAAARADGWRRAFLAYFAPDATTFAPDPLPVLPRLRSQPNTPASEEELIWEPRVGDVAASGDLGWLSGPSISIDHRSGNPAEHGNYFSIWKRQRDGAWRVFIDIGTKTPEAVPFPPGFSAAGAIRRYSPVRDPRDGKSSMMAADSALNAAVAERGPASAYRAVSISTTRLHRNGTRTMPAVGAEAIGAGSLHTRHLSRCRRPMATFPAQAIWATSTASTG